MSNHRSPWMDGFREGDSRVFAELHALHTRRLRHYCGRYATDEDTLDELIQETWVRVFTKRASYRGGDFASWLSKVARTVCLCRMRRPKCLPLDAAVDLPAAEIPDERVAIAMEQLYEQQTTRVLRLPMKQRQVVLLRLYAGLSTRETADVLDCSPGTIKATLHQGIGNLRRRLARPSSH